MAEMVAARNAGDDASYITARNRVVEMHLPWLARVARRRIQRAPGDGAARLDEGDLIAAGAAGLIDAAARFDPSRGVPFRAFAVFYVRKAMADALDAARIVALPHHVADGLRSRDPARRDAASLAARSVAVRSFDAPTRVADEEGATGAAFGDRLPDAAPSPAEECAERERAEALRKGLARLRPFEALILVRRAEDPELRQGDIARCFGITRQAVALREAKALAKIRGALPPEDE